MGKSLKTVIDFPASAASHIICDRICHDLSVDNPVINAISNSVFPTLAFEYYSAVACLMSIVRISSGGEFEILIAPPVAFTTFLTYMSEL